MLDEARRQRVDSGFRESVTPALRVPRQRQSYGDGDVAREVRSRQTRRALLVPATLCGTVALAAAATLGAVAVNHQQHTTHRFVVANDAAGMQRDTAAETTLAEQISTVRSGFTDAYGSRLSDIASAVYRNDTGGEGHPAGPVVFVGAAVDSEGDPQDFVDSFRDAATAAGYEVSRVDVGIGAKGVCAQTPVDRGGSTASCAWATADSFGEVVPAVSGWDRDALARTMRQVRSKNERTLG